MASTINATPTSSGLIQTADNSGVLALQTGGTTAVTIDGSQNVGIGTTSPATNLHIFGNAAACRLQDDGGYYAQVSTDNSGNLYLEADVTGGATSSIRFVNDATERMRIDSSGKVLVGTTSAFNTEVFSVTSPDGNGGLFPMCVRVGLVSDGFTGIQFRNPNGAQGNIAINSSTVSYNTTSDYRLKENIAPMQNALNVVQQLKPVTYKWKSDGSDGQGFIAHELQAIVPDCVTGEKDAVETVDIKDEEGKVIGTKEVPRYQGIDTSFLVATLTAAIQEQQAIITALQADVQALKGVA